MAMTTRRNRRKINPPKRFIQIPNLPDEILQEIQSRLPIESLFQTKFVCQSWRKLINDTRIPKLHYTQTCLQNTHTTTTSLILHHNSSQLYYMPDFHENAIVQLGNLPFRSCISRFSLIGSCNGFLCVADVTRKFGSIFVCNPVVGDCFLVAKDGMHIRKSSEQLIFGFGYEPKRKEFKIVKMIHGEVRLHTVGSDRWRKVGNVKAILYDWTGMYGVLAHGNLHWLGNLDDETRVSIITVYLADEKVRDLLTVPVEGIVGKINQGYYLGELGGCLTVVDDSSDNHVSVWVMAEYGKSESLTRKYVIARPFPIFGIYENRLRPLVLQNDGEILLQGNAGQFFSYNPKANSLQSKFVLIERTASRLNLIRAVTHVGNLLPIKDAIQTEGRETSHTSA